MLHHRAVPTEDAWARLSSISPHTFLPTHQDGATIHGPPALILHNNLCLHEEPILGPGHPCAVTSAPSMAQEGMRRCQELALSRPRHDAATVLLAARRSLPREKYVFRYTNIILTDWLCYSFEM
jgi:hypothetical protein